MKVTRRNIARMLATTAIGTASASPQTDSDEETKSAHDQMRNNAQQLAKVRVPMATEPAFQFKA
jgi:hypothetical protein